jgi:hypothetical protein
MYSGLDRKVHFSNEDLADGAIDLAEIEQESVFNNTLVTVANSTLQAAATVVREAVPRFIETIINHLSPVSPHHPEVTVSPHSYEPEVKSGNHVEVTPPEVFVVPPVETIVVISPAHNNTQSPFFVTRDTVSIC